MEAEQQNGDDEEKEDPLAYEQYGYPKGESKKWGSCMRVLDPKTGEITCFLALRDNEVVSSICSVTFYDKGHGTLVAIGNTKDLEFWEKKHCSGGFIHIYRSVDDGKSMELVHKTTVDGVPLGLCKFQGLLLVEIGQVLRIYDLGKRKLLQKCEHKLFPNTMNTICCRNTMNTQQ